MKQLTILLLLLSAVVLSGCSMSNKEIIDECNFCIENGYDCAVGMNSAGYVLRVQCLPPTN